MSADQIYIKVAKIISDKFLLDENKISQNVTFDALGMDSLDQFEILMRTEESFNIEISDEESEKIFCVKDLVDCVKNKSVQKNI